MKMENMLELKNLCLTCARCIEGCARCIENFSLLI